MTLAEANEYVESLHRHNGRLPAAKFAVAAIDAEDGSVHGIAIAGLPKARMLCDGGTLEVNRICTEGERNCCSFLYGACLRAAKAMGYWRAITYTLSSESGSSLKASGWERVAETGNETWDRRNERARAVEAGSKQRWEVCFADPLPELVWPAAALKADQQVTIFETAVASS